jgi:hypothetical protein
VNVLLTRALLTLPGVLVCGAVMPLSAQTVLAVPAGGNLQAAIDAARPGDTITLAPGATYVGNFTLPAKAGAGYITIRSAAPDALLPRAGERINPSYAAHLPKLRSPNGASVIATAPKAHHYRLLFLEFMANVGGAGDIIRLGDSSSKQNTLAVVPYEIIIDRVYIHGDVTVGQKRGIALNSASTSVINSYISEIKAVGQDSQAICGWNGPGPYLIANNYLEGAGENVMFGGADPAIPNLVPSDITFVGNHLRKPWSWKGSNWTIKNLFELKSARRVNIHGNLFENNWLHAQTGWAILLKSVNQDGGAPWSVVEHVSFTNNIVRHVASGMNILGRGDTRYPALELNNVSVRNNLFTDVSGHYGGHGRFFMITGGSQITVDHNTAITDGQATVLGHGEAVRGFVFTNNVLVDNGYTIKGDNTAEGNPTIARYFPGAHIVGNIIAGADASRYPIANYYPTLAGVGFADYNGGDYRLSPSSPFVRAATDGTDPGVNFNALAAAFPRSVPMGRPDAPRTLTAKVSGSTVTLTWSAAFGPVSSYVLEAGMSPGATNAAVMNTGNTGTSLVVTDVPAGIYYVRVRGANASGPSSPSPEITVVVGGDTRCHAAPPPPRALKAAVQRLTATLGWAAPVGGCSPTHYVLIAGSAAGRSDLAQAAVTGQTLTAGAAPGTYYVRVLAVNAFGVSTPSNEIVVTLRR